MARRVGKPIGNLASQLITNSWETYKRENFMTAGKPNPVQTRGPIRTLDYPSFYNSMFGSEVGVEPENDVTGYSVNDVRKFADEHEITRIVIETCKDQLCKLRWTWRLIPQQGQTAVEVKEQSEKDATVLFLNDFFESPDKEHDFTEWLRILVEEILVCDMVPIWLERDVLDRPRALRIIDTALIQRKINDMGVTPDPNLPYPNNIAYQQIIKGQINYEFTSDELLYFIRNPRAWAFHGYSSVEQVILTMATGMRRMSMQLYNYTDGNVPAMFLRAPKEWSLPQIKDFQIYWNELLAGQMGELSKGWMIPGDVDPIFPQKETLKDDFDEWIARIVCYAFSVSPNAFIKNLNRATSEQAREQADEEGLQSRIRIVTRLMNQIQKKWFGFKNVEFHLLLDRAQDSKKQAEIDNLDIRNGSKGVDEVRRERGYPPIGAPPRVYTTNGYIPLVEGDKPNFDIFQQKLLSEPKDEGENPPAKKSGSEE